MVKSPKVHCLISICKNNDLVLNGTSTCGSSCIDLPRDSQIHRIRSKFKVGNTSSIMNDEFGCTISKYTRKQYSLLLCPALASNMSFNAIVPSLILLGVASRSLYLNSRPTLFGGSSMGLTWVSPCERMWRQSVIYFLAIVKEGDPLILLQNKVFTGKFRNQSKEIFCWQSTTVPFDSSKKLCAFWT